MPQYAFVARNRTGEIERGFIEAATDALVLARLRDSGLMPSRIELAAASTRRELPERRTLIEHLLRPRAIDVETGLQQIAFMLRSGLPLLSALETAADQAPRRSMARVWSEVSDRVQSGTSLSTALSEQSCIPELVISMTSVGERTGDLSVVLLRAASSMERRRVMRTNLATAMTYPAIVVVLSVSVVAYMMAVLMPKLSRFLAGFGRRLPPITQALVDISSFAERWWRHGLIGVLVLVLAFLAIRAWPPGRLAIDRVTLRLPLLGSLQRLAATASFSRHLGLLLTSGVRLTDALSVVEPLLFNRWLSTRVALVRERVLQGAGLSAPLEATRAFEPMLARMTAVGESSGTLDEVLQHVAEHHDSRLQAVIRRLGVLIEPAIVVVLGGLVGFIYLAFFLAIYAIAGGR